MGRLKSGEKKRRRECTEEESEEKWRRTETRGDGCSLWVEKDGKGNRMDRFETTCHRNLFLFIYSFS